MAATAGQERWKGSRSMRERIARSASGTVKTAFLPGMGPGRVTVGDIKSAVSPHWKRIEAGQRARFAGVEEDFLAVRKRRRQAVLSSDFRFVNSAANKAERSARLESEFERFSSSFGGEKMEVNVERESRTKRVRFLENEDLDERRYHPQLDDYSSTSISNTMDTPSDPYWNSTTAMPLRMATQQYPESYETRQNFGIWPGNSLFLNNNSIENSLPSLSETNEEPPQDSTMAMEITPESSTYLEKLSIPNTKTKTNAILRLHEIENHLCHAQSQDPQPPLQDSNQYPLISVSLDTFINGASSSTYFYCPHLECHRRLVYQNANLPLDEGQRCCVHTDCGFVSHDIDDWVKHCTSSHHEFAEHGMGCGCCYSVEDTH